MIREKIKLMAHKISKIHSGKMNYMGTYFQVGPGRQAGSWWGALKISIRWIYWPFSKLGH